MTDGCDLVLFQAEVDPQVDDPPGGGPGPPPAVSLVMKTHSIVLLSIPALAACGAPAPVVISGQISEEGSCSATIGEDTLTGPEGGVRIVSRTRTGPDGEPQRVVVVYCLLSSSDEEEPVRIDFVKLGAPDSRVLEEGVYVIDAEGDQPRTVGVIVTAPGLLDVASEWLPITGTLEVTSATAAAVEAVFEMEMVAGGARTY